MLKFQWALSYLILVIRGGGGAEDLDLKGMMKISKLGNWTNWDLVFR